MDYIEHQEDLLAQIGQTTQARLLELAEEEIGQYSHLRACEISGMIELLKLLPEYQGMIGPLRKHRHWLMDKSEGR